MSLRGLLSRLWLGRQERTASRSGGEAPSPGMTYADFERDKRRKETQTSGLTFARTEEEKEEPSPPSTL